MYQLYCLGELVYVGKADLSLPQRLDRHRVKLSGRLNIHIADVSFTCLYVDEDLDAMAPEKMLINRRRSEGVAAWNFNGFGNNDPGRQRDTTIYRNNHFDVLYPVDTALTMRGLTSGEYRATDLVARLRSGLPYLFRVADRGQHAELSRVTVLVPGHDPTADQLFALLAEAMPGWQVTALPGYVIMYPERREYPGARRVYRAGTPASPVHR